MISRTSNPSAHKLSIPLITQKKNEQNITKQQQKMGEKRKKFLISRQRPVWQLYWSRERYNIYTHTHTYERAQQNKTRHQLFLFRYKKDLRCRHQTRDDTNGNLFSDFPSTDKEFSNGWCVEYIERGMMEYRLLKFPSIVASFFS